MAQPTRRPHCGNARHFALAFAIVVCPAVAQNPATQNPAAQLELPAVEVIGTVPLPGIGVPVNQVPGNVQSATGAQIERRQSLDLPEFLDHAFDGVSVNGAQSNPFQPDLNFRGFTASPLLGTPQGLSVFVDGVRVNEAFGDVVNWDLIPRAAISSVTLIPGSNPVFGLNTLGGALSVQTKSGFQYPGFSTRATGGAFGRRSLEAEYGGHGERVDYFVTANRFSETGWREHSPSDVRQLFAKTGFQDERTDIDVSLTLAGNALNGTQALPVSMLANPRQAYTWPDRTENDLAFINAKASRFLNRDVLIAGNAYYRKLDTEGFFSNINDRFAPGLPAGAGNRPAFNNLNSTDQRGYGASAQLTLLGDILGRGNQFNLGFSTDIGETSFTSLQQEAFFTADRGTAGAGPFTAATSVDTQNRYYGIYAADVLSLNGTLHLTLSGRYNRARIFIQDRSGATPALNGNHEFSRFNPAVGLTYNPGSALTAYAGYNEGMRVPTPAELTCADASAPCQLPSVFLTDPPLRPVIARTWEAGLRGAAGERLKWRAGLFRTDLRDDIQFANTGQAVNSGFFTNIGSTRRQGAELGGEYRAGALAFRASYTYIAATYRTPFTMASANNNSAFDADGDGVPDSIRVNAGNRIPGIPRQMLKLRLEYETSDKLMAGLTLLSATGQFARGDENNQDSGGVVPGYGVLHLDGGYPLDRGWRLVAKVNNLLNRRYETFGVLGTNFFRGPGNTFDATSATAEQFRSSAAPRAAWVGLVYQPDARK